MSLIKSVEDGVVINRGSAYEIPNTLLQGQTIAYEFITKVSFMYDICIHIFR